MSAIELAESKPARVVYGPATFLNQFVQQANALFDQAGRVRGRAGQRGRRPGVPASLKNGLPVSEARKAALAARQSVQDAFIGQLAGAGGPLRADRTPSLTSPTFISSVVFDSRFTDGTPKSKFSYLFPSNDTALISIRLRPELSEAERAEAIDLIRTAIDQDAFRLRSGSYLVTGVPVVVDGLTDELKSEIVVLLDRRPGRDGAGPRAGLRAAAAAASSGDRARRERDRVRRRWRCSAAP